MTTTVKLTQIGDSVGVIVPREILESWHLAEGDTVVLSKAEAGVALSPQEEKIQRQMRVAERVMRENRNLLRRLAQ